MLQHHVANPHVSIGTWQPSTTTHLFKMFRESSLVVDVPWVLWLVGGWHLISMEYTSDWRRWPQHAMHPAYRKWLNGGMGFIVDARYGSCPDSLVITRQTMKPRI